MISITLNCSNLADAEKVLNAINSIAADAPLEPAEVVDDKVISITPDKKTRKKRSSKKNSKKAKDDSPDGDTASADDVKTAVSSCLRECGRPVAVAILKEFSVDKASELNESQFASFVSKCNTAIASVQN